MEKGLTVFDYASLYNITTCMFWVKIGRKEVEDANSLLVKYHILGIQVPRWLRMIAGANSYSVQALEAVCHLAAEEFCIDYLTKTNNYNVVHINHPEGIKENGNDDSDIPSNPV